ncbi:Protein of unknown function [Pyronema omphalodes CBS 100304]|uniref:Uncharacterized protein n=1 Tax=Pyronema omphalodes (strain CBS 100304) TaxID=1076935 RepID=U4L5N8_PYROM|nr:Protein of unknown function [Pyronema omphalodes CBS 100304]
MSKNTGVVWEYARDISMPNRQRFIAGGRA